MNYWFHKFVWCTKPIRDWIIEFRPFTYWFLEIKNFDLRIKMIRTLIFYLFFNSIVIGLKIPFHILFNLKHVVCTMRAYMMKKKEAATFFSSFFKPIMHSSYFLDNRKAQNGSTSDCLSRGPGFETCGWYHFAIQVCPLSRYFSLDMSDGLRR